MFSDFSVSNFRARVIWYARKRICKEFLFVLFSYYFLEIFENYTYVNQEISVTSNVFFSTVMKVLLSEMILKVLIKVIMVVAEIIIRLLKKRV